MFLLNALEKISKIYFQEKLPDLKNGNFLYHLEAD